MTKLQFSLCYRRISQCSPNGEMIINILNLVRMWNLSIFYIHGIIHLNKRESCLEQGNESDASIGKETEERISGKLNWRK